MWISSSGVVDGSEAEIGTGINRRLEGGSESRVVPSLFWIGRIWSAMMFDSSLGASERVLV